MTRKSKTKNVLSAILALLGIFFLTAQCTYTPIFTNRVQIAPGNNHIPAALVHAKLSKMLQEFAGQHGLERCPSFWKRKSESERFCQPRSGTHYGISIELKQKNGTLLLELNEPDITALIEAKESERAAKIWKDLMEKLRKEFPDYVIQDNRME
jgi:hypothetical protein